MAEILNVKNLSVRIDGPKPLTAVEDVSFSIRSGECFALVGESGCGKSLTALSLMRLLPDGLSVAQGEVVLNGTDLMELTEREMQAVRGDRIAMIFQEPATSLNPVMTVGEQIVEAVRLHEKVGKEEAKQRALQWLTRVGLDEPQKRFDAFAHELSGGQKQRVMIAMALACRPDVVVADEPTTALDVSVQAQIIELLKKLCEENGTAVILVTHDMGVIAETADRVAVMYAGRLAEIGPVEEMIHDAEHPYTIGLMGSIPKIGDEQDRLSQIPGAMPHLTEVPSGCAFHPRCPLAEERCIRERPGLQPCGNKLVACWKAGRQNKRMQFPQEPFTIRAPEDMPR